jgi:hypothetical protein
MMNSSVLMANVVETQATIDQLREEEIKKSYRNQLYQTPTDSAPTYEGLEWPLLINTMDVMPELQHPACVVAYFKFGGLRGHLLHCIDTRRVKEQIEEDVQLQGLYSARHAGLSALSKPVKMRNTRGVLIPVSAHSAVQLLRDNLLRVLPRSEAFGSTTWRDVPGSHSWATPYPYLNHPGLLLITGPAGAGKSQLVDLFTPYCLGVFSHREPIQRNVNGDYPSFSPSAVIQFILQLMAHRIGVPITQYTAAESQLMERPIICIDSVSSYLTEGADDATLASTGVSNAALADFVMINNLAIHLGFLVIFVVNPDSTPSASARADLIGAAGKAKANTVITVEGTTKRDNVLRVSTIVTSRHLPTREDTRVTFEVPTGAINPHSTLMEYLEN